MVAYWWDKKLKPGVKGWIKEATNGIGKLSEYERDWSWYIGLMTRLVWLPNLEKWVWNFFHPQIRWRIPKWQQLSQTVFIAADSESLEQFAGSSCMYCFTNLCSFSISLQDINNLRIFTYIHALLEGYRTQFGLPDIACLWLLHFWGTS